MDTCRFPYFPPQFDDFTLPSLQDNEDEKAHLLCNDGLISTIPKDGKAKTMAAAPKGESGFIVYV